MNNIPSKKSIISLALGSALAVTLGATPLAFADENPFTSQSLKKGYMVAEHHAGEMKEGYGDKGQDKKYGEGRCGMSMADTDNDGRVSKEEHARHAQTMFEKMDANGDGYIDKEEANKMRKKHGYGHGQRSGDSSSGSRSGDSGYVERAGTGDQYGYGTRSSDRNLQHMKPMGE